MVLSLRGVMVKLVTVKNYDSRCNIPVDFVAHGVTETAREQEKLRPHTPHKQAAEMEH